MVEPQALHLGRTGAVFLGLPTPPTPPTLLLRLICGQVFAVRPRSHMEVAPHAWHQSGGDGAAVRPLRGRGAAFVGRSACFQRVLKKWVWGMSSKKESMQDRFVLLFLFFCCCCCCCCCFFFMNGKHMGWFTGVIPLIPCRQPARWEWVKNVDHQDVVSAVFFPPCVTVPGQPILALPYFRPTPWIPDLTPN